MEKKDPKGKTPASLPIPEKASVSNNKGSVGPFHINLIFLLLYIENI